MFVDTHAHLMFKDFNGEVDAVIMRAKSVGVERIVNVGCSLLTSNQAIEMAAKYDCLYATLGLHPYDSPDATEELMKNWEKLILENKKIAAIGECGLDYFKARIPKDIQKNAFRLHLKLAQKTGLSVIIHAREADEDCFEILNEFAGIKAVFHCFGSNLEFAKRVWEKGYLTSFTGIITYPKAENLHAVVKEVPLDKFMIETDCPFLIPQKYRGQRNEPAFVVEVAKRIAEIKRTSLVEIERLSTENAMKFFGLPVLVKHNTN